MPSTRTEFKHFESLSPSFIEGANEQENYAHCFNVHIRQTTGFNKNVKNKNLISPDVLFMLYSNGPYCQTVIIKNSVNGMRNEKQSK